MSDQQVQANNDANDSGVFCEALTFAAVVAGVGVAALGIKGLAKGAKTLAGEGGRAAVTNAIKGTGKGISSKAKNVAGGINNIGKNVGMGIGDAFRKTEGPVASSIGDLVRNGRKTASEGNLAAHELVSKTKPKSVSDLVGQGRANVAGKEIGDHANLINKNSWVDIKQNAGPSSVINAEGYSPSRFSLPPALNNVPSSNDFNNLIQL